MLVRKTSTPKDPYGFGVLDGALLEAEIAPKFITEFQTRYHAATGANVKPGSPRGFQRVSGKWGREYRIYFRSHVVAHCLEYLGKGRHVERGKRPYHASYTYRCNDKEVWWDLVENYGFKLGTN